jgi:hypothetical protein
MVTVISEEPKDLAALGGLLAAEDLAALLHSLTAYALPLQPFGEHSGADAPAA